MDVAADDADAARHALGVDEELLERLADVLDRADPMPADLTTTGYAVFTAGGPTNAGRPGSPVPGLPVQPPVQPPLPAVAEGWTGHQTAPGRGKTADVEAAGAARVAGGGTPARRNTAPARLLRWALIALLVIVGLVALAIGGFTLGVAGVASGLLGTPA